MSTVESITSLVYSDFAGDSVDCIVKFDTVPFPVPFTAALCDIEPHGAAIFKAIVKGDYGPIAAYSAPKILLSKPQISPGVVT